MLRESILPLSYAHNLLSEKEFFFSQQMAEIPYPSLFVMDHNVSRHPGATLQLVYGMLVTLRVYVTPFNLVLRVIYWGKPCRRVNNMLARVVPSGMVLRES